MKKIILASAFAGLVIHLSSAQETQHNTIKVKKVNADTTFIEMTPNGDGVNDTFNFGGKNILEMKGQIMDSVGNIIFECTKVGSKWDGKNKKGENVKAGIYYYVMSALGTDGKIYEPKGAIKLIR